MPSQLFGASTDAWRRTQPGAGACRAMTKRAFPRQGAVLRAVSTLPRAFRRPVPEHLKRQRFPQPSSPRPQQCQAPSFDALPNATACRRFASGVRCARGSRAELHLSRAEAGNRRVLHVLRRAVQGERGFVCPVIPIQSAGMLVRSRDLTRFALACLEGSYGVHGASGASVSMLATSSPGAGASSGPFGGIEIPSLEWR